MSKITQTKLARAKYRDGRKKFAGLWVTVKRIIGYEPCQPREEIIVAERKDGTGKIKTRVSAGQIINGKKYIKRKKYIK